MGTGEPRQTNREKCWEILSISWIGVMKNDSERFWEALKLHKGLQCSMCVGVGGEP